MPGTSREWAPAAFDLCGWLISLNMPSYCPPTLWPAWGPVLLQAGADRCCYLLNSVFISLGRLGIISENSVVSASARSTAKPGHRAHWRAGPCGLPPSGAQASPGFPGCRELSQACILGHVPARACSVGSHRTCPGGELFGKLSQPRLKQKEGLSSPLPCRAPLLRDGELLSPGGRELKSRRSRDKDHGFQALVAQETRCPRNHAQAPAVCWSVWPQLLASPAGSHSCEQEARWEGFPPTLFPSRVSSE